MPVITAGIKKLIEDSALALATTDTNGRPHNIALACCKVEGDRIIISNAHIKKTVLNIKRDPRVALSVWYKDWEKAAVGFEILGRAKNYTSGPWMDYVMKLPDNEGMKIFSAIVVKVSQVKKYKA